MAPDLWCSVAGSRDVRDGCALLVTGDLDLVGASTAIGSVYEPHSNGSSPGLFICGRAVEEDAAMDLMCRREP